MRDFLVKLRDALAAKVKDGDLSADDFAQAVRTARASTGGKVRSDRKKAAASAAAADAAKAASEPSAPQHTGVWIGLWLPEDAAAMLAIPEGEAPEALHITLAYLGKQETLDDLTIARALVATDQLARDRSAITANVSGIGRFTASGSSDGLEPLYASVDSPDVDELHEDLLDYLMWRGINASGEHGFTPHITLGYLEPGSPSPIESIAPQVLRFAALTFCIGDKRITLPFTGMQNTPLAYAEHVYTDEEIATICASDAAAATGEATETQRLFFMLRHADESEPLPDWLPYMPKPGTYTHPKWGKMRITKERNANFVKNFTEGVYQSTLPIDLEHETKLSGAALWITGMRQNSDGSVDAQVTWNDRGRAAMEDDRFKYFSPEWFEEWTDPISGKKFTDIAVGGALTTRPFFKEKAMRQLLAASEGASAILEFDPVASYESGWETWRTFALAANSDEGQETEGVQVTLRQFTEEEATRLLAAAERIPEIEKALELEKGKTRTLSETLAARTMAERRRTFTDEVTGNSDGSHRRWYGDVEAHVSFMEDIAEKFGEASTQLAGYIERNRAAAEQMHTGGLFKESGTGARGTGRRTATEQVTTKATQIAATEGIPFAQAQAKVFAESPDLYAQYRREASVFVGDDNGDSGGE